MRRQIESYVPELAFGSQARDCVRWIVFSPYAKRAPGPYAVILSAAFSQVPGWARRKMWLPPSIRPLDDAVLVPSIKTMVRTLDWIMQPIDPDAQPPVAA